MAHPSTVAIVGASLAGIRCAGALRREGYTGTLTLIGAEPHRPYDRPPLSKQYLAGEWDAERLVLVADDKFDDLDLDLRLGSAATGLDVAARSVTLADGSTVTADAIVIATGADARNIPGADALSGVHVLRSRDDADAIRAAMDGGLDRVVVIGAGFIGAEVAATARERGLDVTMVEMAEVPMERGLGVRIGTVCADLHREHGVDLRLGVGVDGLVGEGAVEGVRLSDGSVVDAQLVVVGIGVVPNTDWLAESGLTLDNGVVCDEACRAAPGIYAAGDVARWPNGRFDELMRVEHWDNAVEQGTYVAKRLLADAADSTAEGVDDDLGAFMPVPWFWSDQYDRKIQMAGRVRPDDEMEIIEGTLEERRFAAIFGRGDKLVGVLAFNRPRQVMQYRQKIMDGVSWADAVAAAHQQ